MQRLELTQNIMPVISLLISVTLGFVGIFVSWVDQKPKLEIQILSNISVVKVEKRIDDLEINFKGNNIYKQNKRLSLMTFKMANNGNDAIREGDFPKNPSFKINLRDGILMGAELINCTDNALKNAFENTRQSPKGILFPNFLLNPSEFMIIKFLILHEKSEEPDIFAEGKIANIEKIEINKPENAVFKNELIDFMRKAEPETHLFMFFLYGVSLFILSFVFYNLLKLISDTLFR